MMDKLSQSFLDSCRRDNGRILRGENMTRIETFVDAAFAFVFTMLVISIDVIPRTPQELLVLSRDIPAFLLSASAIGSIWVAHTTWSRTFGLQDRLTLFLSLGLVMLVLIFVYPIKLMIQLTVNYLSRGYLGAELGEMELSDVADLFVYFALGLMALSGIIICLYQNSLWHRDELVLSDYEIFFCKRTTGVWLVVAATALLSCLGTLIFGDSSVPGAGLVYLALGVLIPSAIYYSERHNPLTNPGGTQGS